MVKDLCVICGKIITLNEGRSSHLKKHGIEPYDGAVLRYFVDSRYYAWKPGKGIVPNGEACGWQ